MGTHECSDGRGLLRSSDAREQCGEGGDIQDVTRQNHSVTPTVRFFARATLIAVPLLLLHNQFVERSIDDVFASIRVRWKNRYQAVLKAPRHVLPSPLVPAPRTSLIRLTCLDRALLSR